MNSGNETEGEGSEMTSSQTSASDAAIIDRHAALSRLGGDEGLLRSMAVIFIEDVPSLLQRISSGCAAGNVEQVTLAAHSLRGLAANFNADATAEAAKIIENAARNGDLPTACAHVEQLEAAVETLIDTLKHEVLE